MKKLYLRLKQTTKGDTIIEVMIGLVVLAVAISTVYGISTRSLSTALETKKRTEALGLAQSQIDYLIAANQVGQASQYKINVPFCIESYNQAPQTNVGQDKLCDNYNGSDYNIGVVYDGIKFTITAQWQAGGAPNGVANLNLYYKLSG